MDWSRAQVTGPQLDDSQLVGYLQRLDLTKEELAPPRTQELLYQVVSSQALSIPFEMLDVTLGREFELSLPALCAKLVVSQRGGCCLENNGLLAAALRALGFTVCLRHARVWLRAATYTPDEPPISRQHLVLVVPLPGVGDFLCDVGFGGGSPGKPLLLLDGRVSDAFGEVFKTTAGAANEDTWAVWVWHGEWRRLFSFDHMSESLPHVHAADFIMCSHYVQHAAGTLFMTCRFASKPVEAGGRATLLNGELRIRSAEKEGQPSPPMAVSRLTSAAEFQTVLRDTFKIRVTAEEAAVLWAAEQALPCVNRPTPRPAPPRVADVVLHYLPLRSKGTHIRMLLTAAGILFTDKLYSLTSGEWETTKASGRFPFDCLPVLSFVTVADGKAHEIPEAPAIARLVAAWGGIAADGDPIEAARRDAAYSAVVGLNPVDPIFNGFHTDAAANAAVLDTVVSHLAKIEAGCLGDRPFLGGATPCAADFLLAALSENIEALRPGAFASRDKLRAWLGRARSLPAVKLVLEKEAARAGAPATAA